jgi:hypothetical protein
MTSLLEESAMKIWTSLEQVELQRFACTWSPKTRGPWTWGKNYNFIVTNMCLKFSFSFNPECKQQSNLWTVDSKNVC